MQNPNWPEIYRSAVLEVDATRKPQLILSARVAIADRLKQSGISDEEQKQIADALEALIVMETEARMWPSPSRADAMQNRNRA